MRTVVLHEVAKVLQLQVQQNQIGQVLELELERVVLKELVVDHCIIIMAKPGPRIRWWWNRGA